MYDTNMEHVESFLLILFPPVRGDRSRSESQFEVRVAASHLE